MMQPLVFRAACLFFLITLLRCAGQVIVNETGTNAGSVAPNVTNPNTSVSSNTCEVIVDHCYRSIIRTDPHTRNHKNAPCCEYASRIECLSRHDALILCKDDKRFNRTVINMIKMGIENEEVQRVAFFSMTAVFASISGASIPPPEELARETFPGDCRSLAFTDGRVSAQCKGIMPLMDSKGMKGVTATDKPTTPTADMTSTSNGFLIGFGVCFIVLILALICFCFILWQKKKARQRALGQMGTKTQK